MKFWDRWQAGVKLAAALERYKDDDVVVLGLARGGVVPAAAVALALKAPLDVIVARKIGHPWASEYAIGAVAETGSPVWNRSELALSRQSVQVERAAALQLAARRLRAVYTGGREPLPLSGRTAILVDDGVATGLTMAAAAGEARRRGAATIVASAPVAPRGVRRDLAEYADHVVILAEPAAGFQAVAQYYELFDQVEDEAVVNLLRQHQGKAADGVLNLPALNALVDSVELYPVSSGALARAARDRQAPVSVVQFFESIPSDVTFNSRNDLITRSTEAGLLMEQELTEPPDKNVYEGD